MLSGFGLNDTTIRNWFNGPALLTWSRGQSMQTVTRTNICVWHVLR